MLKPIDRRPVKHYKKLNPNYSGPTGAVPEYLSPAERAQKLKCDKNQS